MQGRPRCETSQRTFRARHDRHALGALLRILFPALGFEDKASISTVVDAITFRLVPRSKAGIRIQDGERNKRETGEEEEEKEERGRGPDKTGQKDE